VRSDGGITMRWIETLLVSPMDKLYAERAALAQELVQIRWRIEMEQARLTFLLHEMAKRKKGKKKPRY
jgi:hypothetical protein